MILIGYALALVIGLILGLLGGGGAILTIPVLVYVFGIGMKTAVPISLVVVGLASVVGVARHRRHGHVRFGMALAFGPAAMAGAVAGSAAALRVSSATQLTVFAILLVSAASLMLWRRPDADSAHRSRPRILVAAIGAGVGFTTGFVGVGGGFMYVPALVLLAGLEMREAVGTSLVLVVLSCAAGLAGYLGRVPLPWDLIAIFTGLELAGVAVGTALSTRVPQQKLRRVFAFFLLALGAFVLLKGERQPAGTTGQAGSADSIPLEG